MKRCISCGDVKPISEYYVHPQMADGHLNKCKPCVRAYARERHMERSTDEAWVEKERTRHRVKYHRLNANWHRDEEAARQAARRWQEQNPEKYRARNASQHVEVPQGMHRHHWSYREEDLKDIIPLSVADHKTVHRFLRYDQSERRFRTVAGRLLATKADHLRYIHRVLTLCPDYRHTLPLPLAG
jgi:hypothetical protein